MHTDTIRNNAPGMKASPIYGIHLAYMNDALRDDLWF